MKGLLSVCESAQEKKAREKSLYQPKKLKHV